MISTKRALARIVLSFAAGLGVIALLLVTLLDLGAGMTRSGVRSVRCLVLPLTSLDIAVHAGSLATISLMLVIVLATVRSWTRQRAVMAEFHEAARRARHQTMPGRVSCIADQIGIRECLHVLESTRPLAVTYGWIRPRILISTGLVERLTDLELTAVLYHEDWHRRRHDPARMLLVQTVTAPLQRAGFVRQLVQHYFLSVEVDADRHAVRRMGRERWLASAMLKTIAGPAGQTSFAGSIDGRVAALAGDAAAPRAGIGRVAAAVVIGEMLIVAGLVRNDGIPLHTALALVHPVC